MFLASLSIPIPSAINSDLFRFSSGPPPPSQGLALTLSSDFLLLIHHKKVGHIDQALFLFFKAKLLLCPPLPPLRVLLFQSILSFYGSALPSLLVHALSCTSMYCVEKEPFMFSKVLYSKRSCKKFKADNQITVS